LTPLDERSLACLLEPQEKMVMATSILKFNRHGKCEQRILILTNQAILNILKNSSILKVFIKKFVKVEDKYEIRRRIPLKKLYGITITPNRHEHMFLLHVSHDHDYYYQA
jgi:hypothetical protein